MYFMYNNLKFLHRKTQSVFFFKFIMIRLWSRHHPAANPSPPFPLCPAAGQRGRGGEGLAELSCRIFFKMASLRLPLEPTDHRRASRPEVRSAGAPGVASAARPSPPTGRHRSEGRARRQPATQGRRRVAGGRLYNNASTILKC